MDLGVSMDSPMDQTTLSTIDLLEPRLLRIENLLYGPTAAPIRPSADSATSSLGDLERRFGLLISRFRVYAEILKIYRAYPSLFKSPSSTSAPALPPTQLTPDAVRATVLSCASAFPAAASGLAAVITDTPVPDPSLSADLVSLLPRMRAVEATQLAQAAEAATLRARSERLVRAWYEGSVLPASRFVAEVESRAQKVEREIRREEGRRERDAEEV